MNRETSKSILLAALVILSLFLTWSIWTYQGNFESKDADKPANIQPIDPENDPTFADVVRPYQLIQIKNNPEAVLGSDNLDVVDSFYKEVLSVKWTTSVGIPNTNDLDSYELVFPAPIKLDTIQTLFDFGQSKTSFHHDWPINRISIYQLKTQSGMTTLLVFRSGDEARFSATSTESVLLDSNSKGDLNKYFNPYLSVQIKGKHVFIPNKSLKYPKQTYPFTLVDIKDFKPIFFSDLLKTYYDKNAYSDGDSFLKQDDNGYVLRYVNPPTGGNSVIRDPVYQGFSFIGSHSGWTDDFIYDYSDSRMDENQANVEFRMTNDGLPVYSVTGFPSEAALISLTWENGFLYKLDRSLINVGKSDLDQDMIPLYSGDQVKTILENGRVPIKSLQDLRIGYRVEVNSSQRLVNFTPDWFYEIGDQWTSLTDFENQNAPSTGQDGGGGE